MALAVKTPASLHVAEDTWPQLRAERMARVSGGTGGVYGRVIHNPYLGYFVHAPSARNRAAKYFAESVTTEDLWQRQKELRNTPGAGWFHPRPGAYSRLHFRNIKQDYFQRDRSAAAAVAAAVGASAATTAAAAAATDIDAAPTLRPSAQTYTSHSTSSIPVTSTTPRDSAAASSSPSSSPSSTNNNAHSVAYLPHNGAAAISSTAASDNTGCHRHSLPTHAASSAVTFSRPISPPERPSSSPPPTNLQQHHESAGAHAINLAMTAQLKRAAVDFQTRSVSPRQFDVDGQGASRDFNTIHFQHGDIYRTTTSAAHRRTASMSPRPTSAQRVQQMPRQILSVNTTSASRRNHHHRHPGRPASPVSPISPRVSEIRQSDIFIGKGNTGSRQTTRDRSISDNSASESAAVMFRKKYMLGGSVYHPSDGNESSSNSNQGNGSSTSGDRGDSMVNAGAHHRQRAHQRRRTPPVSPSVVGTPFRQQRGARGEASSTYTVGKGALAYRSELTRCNASTSFDGARSGSRRSAGSTRNGLTFDVSMSIKRHQQERATRHQKSQSMMGFFNKIKRPITPSAEEHEFARDQSFSQHTRKESALQQRFWFRQQQQERRYQEERERRAALLNGGKDVHHQSQSLRHRVKHPSTSIRYTGKGNDVAIANRKLLNGKDNNGSSDARRLDAGGSADETKAKGGEFLFVPSVGSRDRNGSIVMSSPGSSLCDNTKPSPRGGGGGAAAAGRSLSGLGSHEWSRLPEGRRAESEQRSINPAHGVASPSLNSLSASVVSGGGIKMPKVSSLKPHYVKTSSMITDIYNIALDEKPLGEGSYSRVYAATHRSLGGDFAVKQIDKSLLCTDEEKSALKREVEMHLRLHHRNVVQLHEVYEDAKHLWLVMERTSQGTLSSLTLLNPGGQGDDEETACKLVHQIVVALAYLHENGVLHSDIKPDNVIITAHEDREGHTCKVKTTGEKNKTAQDINSRLAAAKLCVKLCDFGHARKVPNVKYYKLTGDVNKVPYTGACGTIGYMAPELLQQRAYGIKADMWSVGVIMFELIAGFPPFRKASQCLVRPVKFEGKRWRLASGEAKDLCARLLTVEAKDRIRAHDALKHPWFTRFGLGYYRDARERDM